MLLDSIVSVAGALERRDGASLAKLYGEEGLRQNFVFDEVVRRGDSNILALLNSQLGEDCAGFTFNWLWGMIKVSQNDWVTGWKFFSKSLVDFLQFFKAVETNFLVPLLYIFASQAKIVAENADTQVKNEGDASGIQNFLTECGRLLQKGFSFTVNHRSHPSVSKKIGALRITNILFKIYFRLGTLRLCKNLIRTVESPLFLKLESFPMAQQVTYNYYLGRLSMFEDRIKESNKHLTFAFEHCHKRAIANKRRVLWFLIPAKLLQGELPSPALLEKYDLMVFQPLIVALCQGNLCEFKKPQVLLDNSAVFIKKSIFLVLEKLKPIVYRNLFRHVYVALGGVTKLKLNNFVVALRWQSGDAGGATVVEKSDEDEIDEVECILSNLIFQGFIKGYIHHTASYLVVSKKTPFPPVSDVLKRR